MRRPSKATVTKTGLALTTGGASVLIAPHLPLLAALAAALLLAFYLGVVLPAVWSRDPKRRRAARIVLTDILTSFRTQK